MSFDNMSFDNMSFDNILFDNMSFDNMSFDNMSFNEVLNKIYGEIPKYFCPYGHESVFPNQGCQMVYFLTKNLNFGYILEGLGMMNVGIFYGHLNI
jgi:hypothetical protein